LSKRSTSTTPPGADRDGTITMSGRVQIVWESQSLVADRLRLETDPGRLHASGDIELIAAAAAQPGT
jgi:lipopolysaccharide assembly outer membrane protein LptD (OstA)